jgi:hypothetical protein
MNPIMQSALRIEAKVLPGNKIEIDLPPDFSQAIEKSSQTRKKLPF